MKKILLVLFLLTTTLLALKDGTASIFIFFDELALANNEVIVDGETHYWSDEDGSVELSLEAGIHQVEIFAQDGYQNKLSYLKKKIEILASRDTQLIVTFTQESLEPFVELDIPLKNDVAQVDTNTTYDAKIKGIVLSSDTKEPIANARIFLKATQVEVRTDINGTFEIQVPSDTNLTLLVVHSEYSSQTLNGLRLKKDTNLTKSILLTPASMELEEFIVLAPKVKGSIASIMAQEREAQAITNIIGAAEISKKGDSSAASALKRVTGVTLVDGKDIYVRGLGGRYSSVEMNSLPLPSPDPQRRTVPLDIFAASVIGSMQVQKSATADIPASFGGGYLNIRTKDASKENYLKITTQIKGNSNTRKDVNNYQGGASSIPSAILNDSAIVVGEVVPSFDAADNESYTEAITQRDLTTTKESLPFGGKFSIEGAYNLDVTQKSHLSFFFNYTYEQDHKYREEQYFNYGYSQTTDTLKSTPDQSGSIQRTTDTDSNSAIFNLHYNYDDLLHLKLTHLYSSIVQKVTKITEGTSGSNINDYRTVYDLNWEERTLKVTQLTGDMLYKVFDYENKLLFGAEYSTAKLNQPSNYRYTYMTDTDMYGVPLDTAEPYLDRFGDNQFLNLTTDDELYALYLKNITNLELFEKKSILEFGYAVSSKTRESRYNKYMMDQSSSSGKLYEDIDTIYDNYLDYFTLAISFQPAYWYDAEVDEQSYYTKLSLKPLQDLEITMGLKGVTFTQTAYEYTNFNNIFNPIQRVPETLSFNSTLPSFGVKYIFNTKNQLNFAYSQTYIVPDLREFTSGEYFHPYELATVRGNPELQNTDIYNFDLKFSHYFSDTQNINFGVFYKYLKNPIEDVSIPTSSLPIYSYDNADFATLYGFEIDGRKSLDFIDARLHHYYISGNYSLTYSEVTLKEEQTKLYSTNHRDLQGLSPRVLNLSLSYEAKERDLTLSYNKMGERIRKVGMIDGADEYPDYYEIPPAILDFVWIEKYTKSLSLKLKLQNILDEETIWYQGERSNVTNRFRVGKFYSVSVSYKY